MLLFQYTAVDGSGRQVKDTLQAEDKDSLSAALQQRGLFLIGASALRTVEERPAAKARPLIQFDAIPLKQILFFTDQLALMMRSSLPTLEAIECLVIQERHPKFKVMLEKILERIRMGVFLSSAFSQHPEAFDSIYINLLAAGEASGRVPEMLDRVRAYLTFRMELRQKVRKAMTYPVLIMLASVTAVVFLTTFVLPSFADLFEQFDTPLPLPTALLLKTGTFMQVYWYWLLIGGAALYAVFERWRRKPANAEALSVFLLNVPVLGIAVKAIVLSRILRTFAVLVESGVPILRALELVKIAADHPYFAKLMDQVIINATEGRGLAKALYESEHFPKAVSDIIATAERTGRLPEVLRISAAHYQKELDSAIDNTFAAAEPIFVGVLGLVVAGIALCIFYPILSLTTLTR